MMKNLRIIIFIAFIIFLQSPNILAQKEIFIKQIDFELSKKSDIDYENEYFLTMKFNKGSKYIFKITNNINDRTGKAILEVMDADNLILTNILQDKYFEAATFLCSKTEFYDILVKFKDNELGRCQIDIVLVQ